jgi:2-C-methyl-D-erythritol 2,4-cyclodiphosphate synthase
MRIGQGYDVHAFSEGRDLFLCGEKVEYEKGLLGHSDADVALHALSDALLGAAALGDIGKHFPDTDPQYKGISSVILLKHVCKLVREKGFEIENADITIVAQKPKLLPYIPKMRKNTAEAMGVDIDQVNVKATTTEKLGFEGRLEGISSMAVVLLK